MFPCPGCLHDIDLGERGVNGLFRNFTLETIVERHRQAARAAIAIMCDFCKPPPQESTKSCMDCSASYCNECFKVHHPWGTVKAQHEYVGPTTNIRLKVSTLDLREFWLLYSDVASDISVLLIFRTTGVLFTSAVSWVNAKLLFVDAEVAWTYLKGTLKLSILFYFSLCLSVYSFTLKHENFEHPELS